MQTSDSEQVECASLLKRFFDILWSLVPETENDSAEEACYLGRVLQTTTKRSLHPCTRFLRRLQDGISTTLSNSCAILRVTKQTRRDEYRGA